jgi:hypothetical protein
LLIKAEVTLEVGISLDPFALTSGSVKEPDLVQPSVMAGIAEIGGRDIICSIFPCHLCMIPLGRLILSLVSYTFL